MTTKKDVDVTKPHEQQEEIKVDVIIPGHPPRVTTAIFRKTKRFLMKVGSHFGWFGMDRPMGRCWICNKTEKELGQPLEAHHFGIERSYIDASIRWDVVKQDFPVFDWKNFDPNHPEVFVDDMSAQGLLLCKQHHTGPDTGIHFLPFSLWIMQRYLADGSRFNPTEVISHDEV